MKQTVLCSSHYISKANATLKLPKAFSQLFKTQLPRPPFFRFMIQGSKIDSGTPYFKNLPRCFWCTSLLKHPWPEPHLLENTVYKIILNAKFSIDKKLYDKLTFQTNMFFSQLFFTILRGLSIIYRWEHRYLNNLFEIPTSHWISDLFYHLKPILMLLNIFPGWHGQSI